MKLDGGTQPGDPTAKDSSKIQFMRKRGIRFFLFYMCILSATFANAQAVGERFSIHGTINSANTGESLIGATVVIDSSEHSTVSNEYGFFSLTLPAGNYMLVVSAVGMQVKRIPIALFENIRIDIS